ncbi:MAG: hypothetical protein AB7H90_14585 [Alphaproteobacteria bacterium]
MASDARPDHTHLPPATPEEIRLLLRRAGLDLPEDLLQQFLAAWPAYEAMVRRIPRSRPYEEEPAHSFRPSRFAARMSR